MRLAPYLGAAFAVGVLSVLAFALTRFVALPHVSILFLAAVVTSATLWGFGPAVFAALLSVASGSYFFYAPIFSFRVASEQHLADLAVFVLVAAFTSRLASGFRAKALEAREQEKRMAALLAFSERLAASTSEAELRASIIEHLAPVLGRPLQLFAPGAEPAVPPKDLDGELQLIALTTEHGPVGVLAAPRAAARADAQLANALLRQAALALEQARLRREIAEARIRTQSEALREALVNSVTHDLQTPLAAILGSATALETLEGHGDPRAERELVATIREEAERLASYIENVLDLTRIRSGPIAPRLELIELADIIDAALRRKRKALAAHAVRLELPSDLPMLRLDVFLMEHAVANVLDNAAKYAPPGSELAIVARVEADEVVLDVTDAGSGIPAEDLERVFEPFYRGAGREGSPATGTGLGLAICRAFVQANGGSVAALAADGGRGTTLRLRLPVPDATAATAIDDD